jgi:tRNA (guanine-N7-)-methyltransferase
MPRNAPLSAAARAVELVPADYSKPLDLHEIFGRVAPIEVDLGCGDGLFLAAMAEENPERDYLGIERSIGRVRGTCRKFAQRNLTNGRVLRAEIADTVQHLLSPASVDVFHLMFPDPWPKRRHHRRRLVTENFLRSIAGALSADGTFGIVTDHADYFDEIAGLLPHVPHLALESKGKAQLSATSTFEERFRDSGAEIYRLWLRKVSEVR